MTSLSKTGSILCLATFVIVFALTIEKSSGVEDVEKLQLYDCKKVMGRIAKKTIKLFGQCTKEVKANSTKEEFEKKMSCIIKCALDKMHLLTDEGIVTKETVQGFMDEMIPEDAHEIGHVLVEDCLSDHGSKLDKDQPYCESYGEFTQCMQNTIGDFAEKANCNIGALG
ncbi:uncharacterized protein LOC110841696 [Folsomia candida]|uniref:Uncharacterized protein n=1 Tax=Folsomia candida TaxID=158441 RepID=A0A226EZ79_FOLCA|nr:uncharacterized protein LOC110841696 [Folsomia candida]OXA62478.1 hypothetical protein Fcan01_03033 [Folsomia candida]